MLPEVFKFCKSLEQRRTEYSHFYSAQESCADIAKVWAVDLELATGSMKNWNAIWVLSKDACRLYGAMYPSSVVLKVKDVIFDDLSVDATVEVVQDDIELPDVVNVALFELYPTKTQTCVSMVEARALANWLDRCRYFFFYLWYPWDCDANMPLCQWADEHLENRLIMQNDIRTGVIHKSTAHQIQCLITDALDVVTDMNDNDEDDGTEPSEVKQLITIKSLLRRETIKMELDFAETIELRPAMDRYFREKKQLPKCQTNVALVCPESKMEDVALFLHNAKNILSSDAKFQISTEADHVLKSISENGTLLLAPGTYHVVDLGNMAYGGTIRGVGDKTDLVLLKQINVAPGPYVFLSCYGKILLEGITVERCDGLLLNVCEGCLVLKDCIITGQSDVNARGVVVQGGSSLKALNCIFRNLSSGIIAKNTANVQVESCTFINCAEGVKAYDGSSTKIAQTSFTSSTIAGIVFESQRALASRAGTLDILDDIPEIAVETSSFDANNFDVLISNSALD